MQKLCELAACPSAGTLQTSISNSSPSIQSCSYKTGCFKYVLAKQKLCDKVQGWMSISLQCVSTVEKFCPSKAIHVHGNRSQLSNFIEQQDNAYTKRRKSPTLLLLSPSPCLSVQSSKCPFETNTGICKEGAKNANKTYLVNFCF